MLKNNIFSIRKVRTLSDLHEAMDAVAKECNNLRIQNINGDKDKVRNFFITSIVLQSVKERDILRDVISWLGDYLLNVINTTTDDPYNKIKNYSYEQSEFHISFARKDDDTNEELIEVAVLCEFDDLISGLYKVVNYESARPESAVNCHPKLAIVPMTIGEKSLFSI